MSGYDWLLFLHVLFAFALVAGTVLLAPYVLGRSDTPLIARLVKTGGIMAAVGGVGALIFGLILVLDQDYEFFTLWIAGALVLWLVGTGAGERVGRVARPEAARLWWVSSAAVFLILVLMIFKPGA